MKVETRHVKYVFADVVGFTANRTVQAQMEIVGALNQAFKTAIEELETIFLPTGDGICAAIVQGVAAADAHLKVALHVIREMVAWSEGQADDRKCTVRFGINESVDCMVLDINGRQNIAGAGISLAQRLMAMADGNQIVVGRASYDNLRVWDEYVFSFRSLRAESKHGVIMEAFQYTGASEGLNTEVPRIVRDSDPIDLRLADTMAKSSTNAAIAAMYRAVEEWESEMGSQVAWLSHEAKKLEDEHNPKFAEEGLQPLELVRHLSDSQTAFENHRKSESEFTNELRRTGGTMWKPICAEHSLELIRRRVKQLRDLASVLGFEVA